MSQYIHIDLYTPGVFSRFDGSEVVVTPKLVLFWKPPNPFGQWTMSPFEIDGISYVCAEQYMMAEKARLFGDRKNVRQILDSDDPRQQQKFGKQISGVNEEQWIAERCSAVFRG